MNKHTPGPWMLEQDTVFIGETRKVQPVLYHGDSEGMANARLIAAAPDLLFAARCALADLEGIMPEFEPSGDREHPAWQTLKELSAAIDKAEGRAE